MELFVKVFFWVGLIGCGLQLLLISMREYPHKTEQTLGGDLVKFIESAFFTIWAGIVLWGLSNQ